MAKIKRSTESLETKKKELKRNFIFVEALERAVNSRRSQLESEINKSYDHCISILQKKKDQLLSEVDATFTQGNKKIWSAKNDIETLSLQLESCRSFSLRYQKQGHLLSLTSQLIQYLDKTEATKIDFNCLQDLISVRTIFNKPADFNERSLGMLSSLKEFPTKGELILKEGGKTVYPGSNTFQCEASSERVCSFSITVNIGHGTGYKSSELSSLTEGSTLNIGGKQIEVMGVVSEEEWQSGRCFQGHYVSSDTGAGGVASCRAKSVNKGFQNPLKSNNTPTHSIKV
uniref:Uncharacterized protein n=1 Tax=Amphimedon queenslandica TaxID=400682 RepID=A0A1X7SVG5_AMPQE